MRFSFSLRPNQEGLIVLDLIQPNRERPFYVYTLILTWRIDAVETRPLTFWNSFETYLPNVRDISTNRAGLYSGIFWRLSSVIIKILYGIPNCQIYVVKINVFPYIIPYIFIIVLIPIILITFNCDSIYRAILALLTIFLTSIVKSR